MAQLTTIQATLVGAGTAAVRLMVNDPFPGTTLATAIAPTLAWIVAITRLAVVTPANPTVMLLPLVAMTAVPLRLSWSLPRTRSATPLELSARTPTPLLLSPVNAVPVPDTLAVTEGADIAEVAATVFAVSPPLSVTEEAPIVLVKTAFPSTWRAFPEVELARTPTPWVEDPETPVAPPELASTPPTPDMPGAEVSPSTP